MVFSFSVFPEKLLYMVESPNGPTERHEDAKIDTPSQTIHDYPQESATTLSAIRLVCANPGCAGSAQGAALIQPHCRDCSISCLASAGALEGRGKGREAGEEKQVGRRATLGREGNQIWLLDQILTPVPRLHGPHSSRSGPLGLTPAI